MEAIQRPSACSRLMSTFVTASFVLRNNLDKTSVITNEQINTGLLLIRVFSFAFLVKEYPDTPPVSLKETVLALSSREVLAEFLRDSTHELKDWERYSHYDLLHGFYTFCAYTYRAGEDPMRLSRPIFEHLLYFLLERVPSARGLAGDKNARPLSTLLTTRADTVDTLPHDSERFWLRPPGTPPHITALSSVLGPIRHQVTWVKKEELELYGEGGVDIQKLIVRMVALDLVEDSQDDVFFCKCLTTLESDVATSEVLQALGFDFTSFACRSQFILTDPYRRASHLQVTMGISTAIQGTFTQWKPYYERLAKFLRFFFILPPSSLQAHGTLMSIASVPTFPGGPSNGLAVASPSATRTCVRPAPANVATRSNSLPPSLACSSLNSKPSAVASANTSTISARSVFTPCNILPEVHQSLSNTIEHPVAPPLGVKQMQAEGLRVESNSSSSLIQGMKQQKVALQPVENVPVASKTLTAPASPASGERAKGKGKGVDRDRADRSIYQAVPSATSSRTSINAFTTSTPPASLGLHSDSPQTRSNRPENASSTPGHSQGKMKDQPHYRASPSSGRANTSGSQTASSSKSTHLPQNFGGMVNGRLRMPPVVASSSHNSSHNSRAELPVHGTTTTGSESWWRSTMTRKRQATSSPLVTPNPEADPPATSQQHAPRQPQRPRLGFMNWTNRNNVNDRNGNSHWQK